jgi:hypothetical protein
MQKEAEAGQAKDSGDEGGVENPNAENEVFTDEQLNDLIARNDDEFEAFMDMDRARYVAEDRVGRLKEIRKMKPHLADVPDENINYRLIQDWELPEWIENCVKEDEKVDPLKSILGKRVRKEVNYLEHVSDTAYFKTLGMGIEE